jgi:cellulose synthase/poly-beta-1,6-N-acetylglucosamine synthase-like glycosyltransferase
MIVEIMFWIFAILVIYTYIGYPLLLSAITLFYKKPVNKTNIIHSVSLIISAYNEEKNIKNKIINCLGLDYPKDKLEIIIVSDNSNDMTDEIVQQYVGQRIRFFRMPKRGGKTKALNFAVKKAKNDIIVFSDANVLYKKDAIKKLVRKLNDKSVGCVTGRSIFISDKEKHFTKEEGTYEQFEDFIRLKESQFNTCIANDGAIHAIRREDYVPLPADIQNDFIEPLMIYKRGLRCIYEPEAISFEKETNSSKNLFEKKKRIVARGIKSASYVFKEIKILRQPLLFFQLFSHKIIRWSVPFLLLFILILNLFLLDKIFFIITLILQILLYSSALICEILELMNIKIPILHIFHYFCLINLSAMIGILENISGKNYKTWNSFRD